MALSEQLTNIEAVPARQNPSRDEDARIRVKVFTTVAGATMASSESIRLGTLKKGYRLLGMRAVAPADFLATNGTIALGVSGTTGKYLAATAAAGTPLSADGNHTSALLYGTVLAADEELLATVATAGSGAGIAGQLCVTVFYSRD